MKCSECGFENPCVNHDNELCKECDEQFIYCYTKCKNPCRSKQEQEMYFTKWKLGWNDNLKC